MKLTQREGDELLYAINVAEETLKRLRDLEHAARMGYPVEESDMWELKNFSAQISAVLYNVHHGVYRNEVRS